MKHVNMEYINTLTDLQKHYTFECKPRGMKIYENINHTFKADMSDPIITLEQRDLNYRFMFGEAAWILDGRNDLKTIEYYMKGIKRFSDDGIHFYGAYGPKVITQLQYIIDIFKNDLDTRQAVLTIWRENPRSSKDIPCTVAMQFIIREYKNEKYLHCITTMRSNDIWLGTPYDTFNFSAISFYIACRLRRLGINVKLGSLQINAGSRHLYESNWEEALNVRADNRELECWFNFNDLIERYTGKEDLFVANLYKAGDAKKMTLENRLLELKDVI